MLNANKLLFLFVYIMILKCMENKIKINNEEYILKQSNYSSIKTKYRTQEENDELIITTASGMVRGKSFYLDDNLKEVVNPKDFKKLTRVNAWLGIPFAEKPIGDLRFKRPVPIKSWDEILNATQLPNSCFQFNDIVIQDFKGVEMWNSKTDLSEDCLYLNIWTPHPIPKSSPVIVIF